MDIEIPEDLEEYFDQDPLPCLIKGCKWKGTVLGIHIKRTHKMEPAEYKEAIGACKGQPLCTKAYTEVRIAENLKRGLPEKFGYNLDDCAEARKQGVKNKRRQAKQKSSKITIAQHKAGTRSVKKCQDCGRDYECSTQQYKRSRFCSSTCRNRSLIRNKRNNTSE